VFKQKEPLAFSPFYVRLLYNFYLTLRGLAAAVCHIHRLNGNAATAAHPPEPWLLAPSGSFISHKSHTRALNEENRRVCCSFCSKITNTSMFSSPSPQKSQTTPPKTTGWGRALGFFSTAKKQPPPVDASTNDTSDGNADLSALPEGNFHQTSVEKSSYGNDSTPGEDFMSPMTDGPFAMPSSQSATRVANGIANPAGVKRGPRLELKSLSSRMPSSHTTDNTPLITTTAPNQLAVAGERSGLRNETSPWINRSAFQSKATTTAAAHSQTKTAPSAQARATVSGASNPRVRNYRPHSVALVGPKTVRRRYRKAVGEFNQDRVAECLFDLKGSILRDIPKESTAVLAVRGIVQWGSSSESHRLPRPTAKRQRLEQTTQVGRDGGEEDYDGDSRKKRKKVSFDEQGDEENAVVSRITPVGTPAATFKSVASRQHTPMPKKTETNTTPVSFESPTAASADESDDEKAATPSSHPLDSLPEKAPILKFKLGSPLNFTVKVETFDLTRLPPSTESSKLSYNRTDSVPPKCKMTYQNATEWEDIHVAKPPSPEKRKPADSVSTSDDKEKSEQLTKRARQEQLDNDVEEKAPDWLCSKCNTANDNDESKCTNCGAFRTIKSAPTGWGDLFKGQTENKWQCLACYVWNDDRLGACSSCETIKGQDGKKPKSSPADKAPATSTAAPSFSIGTQAASDSSTTKNLVFGAPQGKLPVPTGKPEEPKFSFGSTPGASSSSTTTGGFSFGSSEPAPAPSTGGFIFGATKTEDKDDGKKGESAPASAPFVFGAKPAETTTPSAPAPSVGFSFGSPQPPKRDDTSTPELTFKAQAPAPATEGAKSGTGGSAPAKPFVFGKPNGENGDKKPGDIKPFLFGANTSTGEETEESGAAKGGFSFASSSGSGDQTEGTKAPSLAFGSADASPNKRSSSAVDSEESKTTNQPPTAAPAPAPFSFGGQDSKTPAPAPAFKFGGTPAADSGVTAPASAGGFSFGSPPAPGGSNGGSTLPFPSASKSEPSSSTSQKPPGQENGDSGSQGGPTLLGAPPSAANSSSAPFSFGSTPSAPDNAAGGTFGGSSGPPFGSNSVSKPAPFGGSVPAPAPAGGMQFGSPAPAPAAGSNTFTFGASSQKPASSAPTGFGGAPSTTPAVTSGFGASPSAPAPATGRFGSAPAPATATGGFGAMPSAPAPATGRFGATPSAPAPATGGFGATPSAPAPATGGFGATPSAPPPATGGFGAAPSAAAPAPRFGFGSAPAFGSAQSHTPNKPAAPAFGANSNPPSTTGFGAAPAAFGSQTPSATTQGFNAAAFGGSSNPAQGGFGSTPAPTAGFGVGGFGAPPQTVGFTQQTPAPSGGFGGPGFGAPNTPPPAGGFGGGAPNMAAPAGGQMFNIGSAGTQQKSKRRLIRARRPTRPA
jgi:hypothetical protein